MFGTPHIFGEISSREFEFPKDENLILEKKAYPGDKGVYYFGKIEFDIPQPDGSHKPKTINVLMFDSPFGRNELLTNRLQVGADARYPYRVCCKTVAEVLKRDFPHLIEDAREHRILRAGKHLDLSQFISGLANEDNECKRHRTPGESMFQARILEPIHWNNESVQIISDICPASGATEYVLTYDSLHGIYKTEKLKTIVYNSSTGTLHAHMRAAAVVPDDVEIYVICWEALFSILKENIQLETETIPGGTIINVNHDPFDPSNVSFCAPGVEAHLENIFNKDGANYLDDVPGEVGDKLQEDAIRPGIYDFCSAKRSGWDLTHPTWQDKFIKTMEVPGFQETLKADAPDNYQFHMKNYTKLKRERDKGKSVFAFSNT